MLLGVTLALNFAVKMADRVDDNAYFETAWASAIALGLALDGAAFLPRATRLSPRRRRAVVIVALVLALFASDHLEPLLFFRPAFRAEMLRRAALMNDEAARVHGLAGPIACSVPSVCFRAGKAFVYDIYSASERVQSGHWSEQELVTAERQKHLRFEDVDPRTRWDNEEWTVGGTGLSTLRRTAAP